MARLHLILTFVLVTLTSVTLGESCNGGGEQKPPPPPPHTNIVLLGATGDLAQKYLWNALFELFKKEHSQNQHFTIYGCARAEPDKGRESLSKILLQTVKCSDTACREAKMKFVGSTQYHQLKTEDHYKALGEKMNENTQSMYGLQETEFSTETGRIVYLSIPPGAYVQTATWVHKHLRPKYGHPYFRVVLEKPFGRDLTSAKELAQSLSQYYDDKELYRIDHYLGKTTVQYILPFRQLNKGVYDPIWNKNHIERVEIVMKEKHDVKGRVAFYDDIGVIRDVMQNHLTEILALIAMDVPQDSSHIGKILRNKVSVLNDTYGFGTSRTLLGQYSTYVSEAVNELKKPEYISATPTFAATLLSVDSARWENVPFVMLAGKKLDEKASYVRVMFKRDAEFCVHDVKEACDGTESEKSETTKKKQQGQVIFWIGSNDATLPPMVLVSKSLPKPRENRHWRLQQEIELEEEIFGMSADDMYMLKPEVDEDAYSSLLRAVYEGQRHLFTSTSSLLASWGFWTPIINQLQHMVPRTYTGDGSDPTWLDFDVVGTKKLQFINRDQFMDMPEKVDSSNIAGLPKKFRDQPLVVRDFEGILKVLTEFVVATAEESIAARGSFHFALSGGRSMPQLLGYLASNYPTFPWKSTHIWQVDERCVDVEDDRSNFKLIQRYLLRDVKVIPYANIHRMPVQYPMGLCRSEDNGADHYEAELRYVTNATLDVVILGVGTDGHTASLFPRSALLNEYDRLASLARTYETSERKTESKRKTESERVTESERHSEGEFATVSETITESEHSTESEHKTESETRTVASERMTLTYATLNRARQVVVFVTGAEKHDVVSRLDKAGDDPQALPITGVKADQVTWFMDRDAWFGKQ